VHGEALVGLGGRERPTGEQVVLVGDERHAAPQHLEEGRLPGLDAVDHRGRLGPRVGPHPLLPVEAAHAERHHGHRSQLREPVEHPRQGVVEDGTVVDAGAHHDLAVDLDAGVEQRPEPAQAGGTPPVAQHLGPDVGVGGVDADVEGAEALGHHPLQVGLGEAGEGGEVPVEERQAVVVVLEVEALPQTGRQLVDEAELAVVVAGPDLVEEGRGHLHAHRLTGPLVDLHGELEAAAGDLEGRVGLVDEGPPLQDVPRGAAVDGEHLVAHGHAGARRGRAGRDGDDTGSGHRPRIGAHPAASPGP
jgi:hypothetical protein